MASEFIFTSPGVKFRERDLTSVTRQASITNLGLVGETLKGPAFEPIFIQDKGQFRNRFGSQSTEKFPNGDLKYQLPYAANSYLEESSELYVTRILGLSGYDAGTAWAIRLSAGVDPSTTGDTANVTSNSAVAFSDSTYLGVTINQVGQVGTVFTGFTKTTSTDFVGFRVDFTANTLTNGSGTVDETITEVSGTSYSDYEGMVLAVIRSRANVEDAVDAAPIYNFEADDLSITANETNDGIGDLFGQFQITATNSVDGTSEAYTVSLDPNSREFLPNVLGTRPKGKNTKLFVEAIYPELIKKLDADGIAYGVDDDIIDATSDAFTNYEQQYQTPETPWIVSELRGTDVQRLFKFISISDGNSANREIKISLQNIDPISGEFDIVVRDFFDTDSNIIVLESFTRCTMREGENNYVGRRVGTADGEYPVQSQYIYLDINKEADQDSFPAGFEGYAQKDYSTSATTSSVTGVAPEIFYKQSYNNDERLNRTYLGISEKAYDSDNLIGRGVNQNLFNYIGQSGFVKTKGFHMDSGATSVFMDGNTFIGEFKTGAARFRTASDVVDGQVYGDARSRKFTVVPAGGFDGWNEHRNERSNGDLFRKGGIFDGVVEGATPSNDFQAWETGIATFANPEDITINLFATPGINWSDNLILVEETIEMIERDRADSLYVIDSPDIDVAVSVGERADIRVAQDIVGLLESTPIDSSYSATYYPWIQYPDSQNNVNVYIPPTGEVLKAMAFTDNTKFPWFAPAGIQRGSITARRSKYKLSEAARGILYSGRINGIADFSDVGSTIFGQKTMQVRESALDRINVRRLLLQIKVVISNIANRLLFEQNDQTTIDQFLAKANPILDSIRRERGLQDFRIKMDDTINSPESIDRNELYGEISIKPTRAVEYIGITFNITPTGASFEDI